MKRILLPLLTAIALPTAVLGLGYEVKTNLMTDEKEIEFLMMATDSVKNDIGIKKEVYLFVRCEGGDPEIFVMTPTYNGENNLVGVRWNEDKPSYEYWSQSTNKKGYFVPDVKAFVKEIMQSYFLTFQWEPEDSNKKAVRFALNAQDFKKELEQAQKDGCNLGLTYDE